MPDDPRELLLEAALTAHRPLAAHGELAFHPAFCDLDARGREALFEATMAQRALERATTASGLSSTAQSVLRRIRGR